MENRIKSIFRKKNCNFMAKNLDQDSSLPVPIEAEKAVLGGIMLKNDTWDLVAAWL